MIKQNIISNFHSKIELTLVLEVMEIRLETVE